MLKHSSRRWFFGNKKNKTAVALSYEVERGAPTVVASGTGYVADQNYRESKGSKCSTA